MVQGLVIEQTMSWLTYGVSNVTFENTSCQRSLASKRGLFGAPLPFWKKTFHRRHGEGKRAQYRVKSWKFSWGSNSDSLGLHEEQAEVDGPQEHQGAEGGGHQHVGPQHNLWLLHKAVFINAWEDATVLDNKGIINIYKFFLLQALSIFGTGTFVKSVVL